MAYRGIWKENQATVNNTHLRFSYHDGWTVSAVKRPQPGPSGLFFLFTAVLCFSLILVYSADTRKSSCSIVIDFHSKWHTNRLDRFLHKTFQCFYLFIWQAAGSCLSPHFFFTFESRYNSQYTSFITIFFFPNFSTFNKEKKKKHTTTANVRKESMFLMCSHQCVIDVTTTSFPAFLFFRYFSVNGYVYRLFPQL